MLTPDQYQEFSVAFPDCDLDKAINYLKTKTGVKNPVSLLRKILNEDSKKYQKYKPIDLPKSEEDTDSHYRQEYNFVKAGRKEIRRDYMFLTGSQAEKDLFLLWLERSQDESLNTEAEISMALYGQMPDISFETVFFEHLTRHLNTPFSVAWQRFLDFIFTDFKRENRLYTEKTPAELKQIGWEIWKNKGVNQ